MNRRLVPALVLVGTLAAAAALAGSPPPVAASCARFLSFEEAARLPGAAVFTGRAVREDAEYRLVFDIERWYAGGRPARTVLFRDELAGLIEEAEAGVIPAVLARTTSGDGFGFNRGELVIVIAVRSDDGQYGPVTCTQNVVPVATPEGRALVEAAIDLFGPGAPASRLPATATLADAAPAAGSSAPWLPVAVFVVALVAALKVPGRRRTAANA